MSDRKSVSRWRAWLTAEKGLARLGPLYLVRNSWLYVFLGWGLAALLLVGLACGRGLFVGESAATMGIWYAPGFLACCAVLVALLFTFRLKVQGKLGFWVYSLLFAGMPFAAYYMVEYFNGYAAYDRVPEVVFMNLVAYALVYLALLVIVGSYRWAGLLGTGLLYLFALICYFVLLFRGTPFVPLDVFSAGTAGNVVSHYVFELSPRWLAASVQAGLMMGVSMQLGGANLRRVRWKLTLRALAALVVLGAVSTFFSGAYLEEKGYAITYWNQQESYENYGEWFAFCINLRNVYPERPENYSADTVSDIVGEQLLASGLDPEGDTAYNILTGENDYTATGETPNIILIMNESFADLQSMGSGFETSVPVMPFFDSLEENTICGTIQVSIAGGGTACSEYEVLTGNSQSFLPSGAVAYSANIHDATPSMVWTLREQGYQTTAFHPYAISGWNRETAYTCLGFEDLVFIEDLFSEDILAMSAGERMAAVEETDPEDGDVYNRDYMSDHYDFKLITELYEDRDPDQPFFLFNVTIQNHGGYADPSANFEETVRILDMEGDYPQAELYLSLIRATDEAFEELITYFEGVDEPTLVIMFGDHIPSVDVDFYDELFGASVDDLTVEELQSRFQTPFVIWANYDIEEADLGTISANYFSTLIMETAGLELTPYNRYLASLYEEVPVVSSVGYQDAAGNASRGLAGQSYKGLIDGYQCVAYNNLLDYTNRNWSLFTLGGSAMTVEDP